MENNFKRREADQNDIIKRKKNKYNIKEEIPSAYKHNSNLITFFKIIKTEDDFNSFNKELNLNDTFSPVFTNQIFNQKEEIIGYKNLKILISLTPKLLFPFIKIVYEDSLNLKDDLNLLLSKHYETSYNNNEQIFLNNLKEEENYFRKGELIFKNRELAFDKEVEIYLVDILKDDLVKENMNLQSMITFFIDGASAIPIENNFWHYFLLFEKVESKQLLIGYCSTYHFHMSINKYRSMISQFLILPQYQKKGYGQFLLDKIYDFYISDSKCIEVTVEDPAIEFILLRDVTIFSKILKSGFFKNFLKLFPINHLEEFKQIKLEKEHILNISNSFKIPKNMVYRSLEIFKYLLVLRNPSNQSLYNSFRKEVKMRIYRNHKADMDPNYLIKGSRRKGPYISFHDDEDFRIDTNELLTIYGTEASRIEKLELYYNDLEGDYKKISSKCERILKDYDNMSEF